MLSVPARFSNFSVGYNCLRLQVSTVGASQSRARQPGTASETQQILDLQRFFGTAVGKGRQGAKTDVERLDLKNITCRQAVKEVAKM